MKVLVVGGGGREHAIVTSLAKSPRVKKLWCAPGNGGIAQLAECLPIPATDIEGVTKFSLENSVDFVVVAPDDPLALGMVDVLKDAGIRAFGPCRDAAIIESSKIFSKKLMKKYGIPTAEYETFSITGEALEYIDKKGAPIVVKADGLARGKGVVVAQTVDEARDAVNSMMEDMKFGDSGSSIVIEECMSGPEVTVLAFTDGKTVVPMLSSQDHKRAYDNDEGPNTGGMGAFCPSPKYTDEIAQVCMETIFQPTINAMRTEGRVFKGVIYFGLMLTQEGPKVIEYNARFGDPEAQAVLTMLDTDLMDIFEAVEEERLGELEIKWKNGAACCIVVASKGYPNTTERNKVISGLDNIPSDITVFHAGTKLKDDKYVTGGGRELGVTAYAASLPEAARRAYEGVELINFDGMFYRKDIGQR